MRTQSRVSSLPPLSPENPHSSRPQRPPDAQAPPGGNDASVSTGERALPLVYAHGTRPPLRWVSFPLTSWWRLSHRGSCLSPPAGRSPVLSRRDTWLHCLRRGSPWPLTTANALQWAALPMQRVRGNPVLQQHLKPPQHTPWGCKHNPTDTGTPQGCFLHHLPLVSLGNTSFGRWALGLNRTHSESKPWAANRAHRSGMKRLRPVRRGPCIRATAEAPHRPPRRNQLSESRTSTRGLPRQGWTSGATRLTELHLPQSFNEN